MNLSLKANYPQIKHKTHKEINQNFSDIFLLRFRKFR